MKEILVFVNNLYGFFQAVSLNIHREPKRIQVNTIKLTNMDKISIEAGELLRKTNLHANKNRSKNFLLHIAKVQGFTSR